MENFEKRMVERIMERFPAFCRYPMGERHREFWAWRASLTQARAAPFVAIWPRGGAKSATAELFVCEAGESLLRPYAVYISETQEQADKHVAAIGTLFDGRGLGRAVNKYGHSKGWRRDRLCVGNGFTVDALGFDTAARGLKLDENRPGILVFDDIDGKHDTEKTTQRKIEIMTDTLLPAMAENGIVLFVQNLIHRSSIATRLSGLVPEIRADFLIDRIVSGPFPAIEDLETATVYDACLGANRTMITGGNATWEGQSVEACQGAIDTFGLGAFLRESQHEVFDDSGAMFRRSWFEVVDEVPLDAQRVRRWDMAATQGGGDWTVGVLMARVGNTYFIEDVARFQKGSAARDEEILRVAGFDGARYGTSDERAVRQVGPQDPGSAGVDAARHFKVLLWEYPVAVERESGDKVTRADGFASEAGKKNVKLLRGAWNEPFLRELEMFPRGEFDDQVDAGAGAYNRLVRRREIRYVVA